MCTVQLAAHDDPTIQVRDATVRRFLPSFDEAAGLFVVLADGGVANRLDAWRAKQTKAVAKRPKGDA